MATIEKRERAKGTVYRAVVRLKGYVRVQGRQGMQEVQWVMGSLSIAPYQGVKQ